VKRRGEAAEETVPNDRDTRPKAAMRRPSMSRPSLSSASIGRVLAIGIAAAGVAGAIAVDRKTPVSVAPAFGVPLDHPMPYLVDKAAASTWFCSGVPATADGAGSFVVSNPTDSPIQAVVSLVAVDGKPTRRSIAIPVRGHVDIPATEAGVAEYAAATVEISGVGGLAEQRAVTPEGTASSPCSSAPSSTWYLAEGSTALGDSLTITLYNPYPADAIVDLSFADEEGVRAASPKYKGRVIPGRAVVMFPVSKVILRKRIVAVAADVRNGLVVMGRHQVYGGQDSKRTGVANGVAIPSASTSWRFANNQKGPGSAQRFAVFNPSRDSEITVNATILPAEIVPAPDPANTTTLVADPAADPAGDPAADPALDPAVEKPGPPVPKPLTITVGPQQVGEIDLASADLVDGVYSVVVSSSEPVVVERVLNRTLEGGLVATSVQAGARLTSPTWFVDAAPAPAVTLLYVLNATGDPTPSTFSVKVVGPNGAVAVPGFESVPIGPGALVGVDLSKENVAGEILLVEASTSLVVERVINTGKAISSSLGLPVVVLA
jgi:hypothetical protein